MLGCKQFCRIAAAFLLLSFSTRAHAQESYYLVLFSYDGPSAGPRDAHTFAAFVKQDTARGADLISVKSISWLPNTKDVRLLKRPEAGMNLTLEQTLKLAAERKARVTAWGPYRIKRELYDRAVAQIDRLESGKIAFKTIDIRFRGGAASNCMHAVSDVADAPLLDTGINYGVSATAMIRDHFKPWITEKAQYPSRVKEWLGLDRHKIDYRD